MNNFTPISDTDLRNRLWKAIESKSVVPELAKLIIEQTPMARDKGGALYAYQSGVYARVDNQFFGSQVQLLFEKVDLLGAWTTRLVSEVAAFIKAKVPVLWDRPPLDVLNLKNGLLDVRTRELRPRTSDHLSSIQLPILYDAGATCPSWDKFFEETLPKDCIGLAWEMLGWLMVPDTSIQKLVVFLGPGGTGKSAHIAALTAFLGRQNISGLTLQQLSEKFFAARLYAKLANFAADLPTKKITDTGMLKSLTGGDDVEIEEKFKSSFLYRPFARYVFSANTMPSIEDPSDAVWDRFLIIPKQTRFRGTAREINRPELDARHAEPAEQSGALNRGLDGLDRLRRRGRFANPSSVRAALDEAKSTADPVKFWTDRRLTLAPHGMVPKQKIENRLNNWLAGRRMPLMSPNAVTNRMAELFPGVGIKQRKYLGVVRTRVYLGIKWVPSNIRD